jgi:hypothetical protein
VSSQPNSRRLRITTERDTINVKINAGKQIEYAYIRRKCMAVNAIILTQIAKEDALECGGPHFNR